MADALDSKSGIRKGVRVRLPPPVPLTNQRLAIFLRVFFFCLFAVFNIPYCSPGISFVITNNNNNTPQIFSPVRLAQNFADRHLLHDSAILRGCNKLRHLR